MKKITLLILLLIMCQFLMSQKPNSIDYYDWSSPETFKLSPSPIIKGYGYYSDSLSKIYDGKTFYVHNDEYYCIESWADYYYWFTQEYRHLFNDPQIYEYYYFANDDYGMASYIASNKYLGDYYPSSVKINFPDQAIEYNRLENDKFFASDQKKVNKLNNQMKNETNISNTSESSNSYVNKTPTVFNKQRDKDVKLQNNEYSKEAPGAINHHSKVQSTKNAQ